MSQVYPLLSEAARYAVTVCPQCAGTDLRGPHDTTRSATGLFLRTWFCRACWWSHELQMKDDTTEEALTKAVARGAPGAKRARG